MNHPAGIEQLRFRFSGGRNLPTFEPVLVGVVGSGNLEVLLEPHAGGGCVIDVQTSARGFQAIWAAVLQDFHQRHGAAALRVSINDMGATPAVVSLRLAQALAQVQARSRP